MRHPELLGIAAIALAGTAASTPPARATEVDAALKVCAAIPEDLDRLACYDRVSGKTPKRAIRSASSDNWVVTESVSKLTDDRNVTMYVSSDKPVDCGWNRGDKILLVVRCHENTTSMYFVTGCHMASSTYNDYGDITYRLDELDAQTVGGDASTDGKALGLWRGAQSIPVIKQMFGKTQMVVRMLPYNQNAFTATFDISGLEDQIAPLRTACNW